MSLIKDKYERVIDYMRISITDRCNLRCFIPSDGMQYTQRRLHLSVMDMRM